MKDGYWASKAILEASAGEQEQDPLNQRVQIRVGGLSAGIISLRFRIIHEEFDVESNQWIKFHRVFETAVSEDIITVGQLVAGRYYTFQVAAVNEVDEGPYSAIFPDTPMGLLVGRRTVTIEPFSAIHQSSGENRVDSCTAAEAAGISLTNTAPNWLAWHVRLTISELPRNQENAASVEFSDGNGTSFNCLNFELDPDFWMPLHCNTLF